MTTWPVSRVTRLGMFVCGFAVQFPDGSVGVFRKGKVIGARVPEQPREDLARELLLEAYYLTDVQPWLSSPPQA